MKQEELSSQQAQAAQKAFAWMARSKPSVSARDGEQPENNGKPDGIALPPHERGCGPAHPIRGTNREDLAEWCAHHQT